MGARSAGLRVRGRPGWPRSASTAYPRAVRVGRLAPLLLLACAPVETVRVELPVAPGRGAILVAVLRDGALLSLSALPGDASRGLPAVPDWDGGPLELAVLEYDRPLDRLGLEPGPIVLDPDGLTLPEADRVQRGEIAGAGEVRWRSEALPPALVELRLALPRDPALGCPVFVAEIVDTDIAGDATASLVVDEGVLIFTDEDQVALVGDSGPARRVEVPAGAPARAVLRGAGDRLWLGGPGGSLARARWSGGRIVDVERVLDRPTPGDDVYWVGGSDDGRHADVAALTEFGRFAEVIDGVVQPTVSLVQEGEFRSAYGGVSIVAPGDFVVTHGGVRGVARRRRPGEPFQIVETGGIGRGFAASGVHEGLGLLVTQVVGAVYVLDGEGFRALERSKHELEPCAMSRYRDGLMIVGRHGATAMWRPRLGMCPIDHLFTGAAHAVATLPDAPDVLVVAGNDLDGRTVIRRFRPQE